MDRERPGYSDSDSMKMTAGGTCWTGRGQVTVTVAKGIVERQLLEGLDGQGEDRLQ